MPAPAKKWSTRPLSADVIAEIYRHWFEARFTTRQIAEILCISRFSVYKYVRVLKERDANVPRKRRFTARRGAVVHSAVFKDE